MVEVPAEAQPTPNDAPDNAQPRAGWDGLRHVLDSVLRTMEQQGETIARLAERTGRAETERYNASARADKAEAEHARLTERLIELERENAVRADALELAQAQLDEARAALEARQRADDRPWWKFWE